MNGNYEFYFEPSSAYAAYSACVNIVENFKVLLPFLNAMIKGDAGFLGDEIWSLSNGAFHSVQEIYDNCCTLITNYNNYLTSMMEDDPEFALAFNILFYSDGNVDADWLDDEWQEAADAKANGGQYDGDLSTNMYFEFLGIKSYCDAAGIPVSYFSSEQLMKEDPQLYLDVSKYSGFLSYLSEQGQDVGSAMGLTLDELYDNYGSFYNSYCDQAQVFDQQQKVLDFCNAHPGVEVPSNFSLSQFSESDRIRYFEWDALNSDGIQSKINDCGFTDVNTMSDLSGAINIVSNKINELQEALDECHAMINEGAAVISLMNYIRDEHAGYCPDFEKVAKEFCLGYTYLNSEGDQVFVYDDNTLNANERVTAQPVIFADQFGETDLYKQLVYKFEQDPYYADKFFTSGDGLYQRALDSVQEETLLEQELQKQIENKAILENLYERIPTEAANSYETELAVMFEDDYVLNAVDKDSDDINELVSSLFEVSDYDSIDDVGNYIFNNNNDIYRYLGADGKTWCLHVDDSEMLNALLYSLVNGNDSLIVKDGAMYFQIPGAPDGNYCYIESDDPILRNYITWSPLMTDGERAAYCYYWNTGGSEAAYNYLDGVSDIFDARYVDNKLFEDQQYALEHPGWASVKSVIMTPFEGIAAAGYSFSSLLSGDEIRQSHVYSTGDTYRTTVAASIDSPFWSFVYTTGMSMADSALLIGVNALTMGTATFALSAALMGSRIYVSTLNDALDRGLSDGQAVFLAMASAGVESVCEAFSVGKLMNLESTLNIKLGNILQNIDDPVMHNICKVLGGAAIQGLNEGQEEVCAEILNNLVDRLVSGDLSHFSLSVNEKISNGYSLEEAIAMTSQENIEQLGMAFLGGFLSGFANGGFFTGVDVVITEKNISAVTNAIFQSYNDSTYDAVAKSIRMDLRHGDYSSAVSTILNDNSIDIADRMVAANALTVSISQSMNLTAEQAKDIDNKLETILDEFLKLDPAVQASQFAALDAQNQMYFHTLLDPVSFGNMFSHLSKTDQEAFLVNFNDVLVHSNDSNSVQQQLDNALGNDEYELNEGESLHNIIGTQFFADKADTDKVGSTPGFNQAGDLTPTVDNVSSAVDNTTATPGVDNVVVTPGLTPAGDLTPVVDNVSSAVDNATATPSVDNVVVTPGLTPAGDLTPTVDNVSSAVDNTTATPGVDNVTSVDTSSSSSDSTDVKDSDSYYGIREDDFFDTDENYWDDEFWDNDEIGVDAGDSSIYTVNDLVKTADLDAIKAAIAGGVFNNLTYNDVISIIGNSDVEIEIIGTIMDALSSNDEALYKKCLPDILTMYDSLSLSDKLKWVPKIYDKNQFIDIGKSLGYTDVAIDMYLQQINSDVNWDLTGDLNQKFKANPGDVSKIMGITFEQWNKYELAEKYAALDTYFDGTVIAAKNAKSWNASLETLRLTMLWFSKDTYDISASDVIIARMNAKKGIYTEAKTVKVTEDYTDYFPKADWFITDSHLYTITMKMLGITDSVVQDYCKDNGFVPKNDLDALGHYLKYNQGAAYVTGTTYQDATTGAKNLVKFGCIGPLSQIYEFTDADGKTVTKALSYDEGKGLYYYEYWQGNSKNIVYIPDSSINFDKVFNTSGGAYVLLSDAKTMADNFPDYCEIRNNELVIKNMEMFGKVALSGVTLNSANGAYKITFRVPISECSIPSVNNGAMYTDYGVPGGYLASLELETVVTGTDISEYLLKTGDKNNPYAWKGDIDYKDSDTGKEIKIEKINEVK